MDHGYVLRTKSELLILNFARCNGVRRNLQTCDARARYCILPLDPARAALRCCAPQPLLHGGDLRTRTMAQRWLAAAV
eukprot:COSAG06_NODE_13798_length_1218_cov_1.309205_2_plen_78_part_00